MPTAPARMHFPMAKRFAQAGHAIRRAIWDGGEDHELAWLRYEGGLWFYLNDDGQRVAINTDMLRDDFLAWDWTTLAPTCEEQTDGPDALDLYAVLPYDEFEDTAGLGPPSLTSAGNCELPPVPPRLGPSNPIIVPPEGGGGGGGNGNGNGNTGTGGSLNGGGFGVNPWPGGFGGGSSSGSGSSGGNNKRPRRPRTAPVPPTLTVTADDDLPGCLPRLPDECERLCEDPAYPVTFTFLGGEITLGADASDPGAIWFWKVIFNGAVLASGTISPGETETYDGPVADVSLGEGAHYTISASAWKSGRPVVHANTTISLPDPCSPDPDCGEPCDPDDPEPGSGGSGSGGSGGEEPCPDPGTCGGGSWNPATCECDCHPGNHWDEGLQTCVLDVP